MRLIDADEILEYIEKEKALIPIDAEKYHIDEKVVDGMNAAIRAIENEIKEQPTAYDVDKVVEELEERKTQYGKLQFARNDANMVYVYVGKEQAIDCAIDIVRKGGVE